MTEPTTPEVIREKIESFTNELIEKTDERRAHGADVLTTATGRMTVVRIGGIEYDITCTLKVRENPAK